MGVAFWVGVGLLIFMALLLAVFVIAAGRDMRELQRREGRGGPWGTDADGRP